MESSTNTTVPEKQCIHEWRACEWKFYSYSDLGEEWASKNYNYPERKEVTQVFCIHCLTKKYL